MTIESSSSINGAGAIRPEGLQSDNAGVALDAARAIGVTVAGRVLAEFGIGGAGAQPVAGGDIYGLGALTDGIAAQLPAGDFTSLGGLSRAVEAFAGAVAADVAALPDGGTLDRIEAALTALPQPGQPDLGSVTDFLESAAARLNGGQ